MYGRNATKNEGDAVVIDFGLLASDLGSQNSNSTFSFSIVDGDCTSETQVYVQCPFSPAMSPPELSCPAIFARMKACLII